MQVCSEHEKIPECFNCGKHLRFVDYFEEEKVIEEIEKGERVYCLKCEQGRMYLKELFPAFYN